MFKRKNKKKDRSEQFIEASSPLSYPIGQAAQTLGMSKRTLMRRAEAMGLEFEWDGRGRRVRRDDLQRLLSGERLDKKSNAFAESDDSLNTFDEEDERAAYDLELPIDIRVWQRLPSGRGTVLKGDQFCDKMYGCVHELIKPTYGPGEYIIRPIENGVLSNRRYKVRIYGEPWILSQTKIRMENKNKKEAFNENAQSKKDKQISRWLDPFSLRVWWIFIEVELHNQKCFLTLEHFISARRSFKLYLEELEEEEFKLINRDDARDIFESHVQRLCPKIEQNDDARFSDSQEETQRIEAMLEEIRKDFTRFEKDFTRFEKKQAEENSLLWVLCAICLALLLILIYKQPPQFTQQPTA
jgi:excisionase family DNA binding protein